MCEQQDVFEVVSVAFAYRFMLAAALALWFHVWVGNRYTGGPPAPFSPRNHMQRFP